MSRVPDTAVLLALIVRIPADGVDAFRDYEDRVLPLLADHGGVLERRVRTGDGTTEIHLVRFPSEAAFDRFRLDSRRTGHAPLMAASGAAAELLRVEDVAPGARL